MATEHRMRTISFDIGIRNFAYAIMDSDGGPASTPRFIAVEVVDLGCAKNNTQRIIDRVIEVLDEIFQEHLADAGRVCVLIEQQMTSVMKAIQTTINIFFKLNARYQGLDITTRYLSAHHKLALMGRFPEFAATAPTDDLAAPTTKYKRNKNDSVRFVAWLLENKYPDSCVQERIRRAKKADDLCDTYLMCLYQHLSQPATGPP